MKSSAISAINQVDYVIVHKPCNALEICDKIILGRWEVFGYRNHVSGTRRMLTALYQTIVAFGLLTVIYLLLDSRGYFGPGATAQSDIGAGHATNAASAMTAIIAIFAGTFLHERSNHYAKWQYLAGFFNTIVSTQDLKQDHHDHMLGCLGFDILTMEMWAHESFRDSFKIALAESIYFDCKDENATVEKIARVVSRGIKYEEARELLSNYASEKSPVPISSNASPTVPHLSPSPT